MPTTTSLVFVFSCCVIDREAPAAPDRETEQVKIGTRTILLATGMERGEISMALWMAGIA